MTTSPERTVAFFFLRVGMTLTCTSALMFLMKKGIIRDSCWATVLCRTTRRTGRCPWKQCERDIDRIDVVAQQGQWPTSALLCCWDFQHQRRILETPKFIEFVHCWFCDSLQLSNIFLVVWFC